MRIRFVASVAKYPADEHLNEDANGGILVRGIYAVSDGASDSYNSAPWSKILVSRFIRQPRFDANWLHDAVETYNAQYDREAMSWSAQAAFDRGSFATLTGIMIAPSGANVRVLGFGDSLAVLVADGDFLASFPYERAEQFAQHPLLLSTNMARNDPVLAQAPFTRFVRTWNLTRLRNPTVLCMTDALGAWLLKAPRNRLRRLLALKTRRQFVGFVEHERSAERMRRDDTTLLVVR